MCQETASFSEADGDESFSGRGAPFLSLGVGRRVDGVGQVVAEAVEAALDVGPSFGEPSLGRAQRRRVDAARARSADLLGSDEAAGLGLGRVDQRRPAACRVRSPRPPLGEPFDHQPSARVRECLERPIQRFGLVKHMLLAMRVPRNPSIGCDLPVLGSSLGPRHAPITHPAQKRALTDLLTRFEWAADVDIQMSAQERSRPRRPTSPKRWAGSRVVVVMRHGPRGPHPTRCRSRSDRVAQRRPPGRNAVARSRRRPWAASPDLLCVWEEVTCLLPICSHL